MKFHEKIFEFKRLNWDIFILIQCNQASKKDDSSWMNLHQFFIPIPISFLSLKLWPNYTILWFSELNRSGFFNIWNCFNNSICCPKVFLIKQNYIVKKMNITHCLQQKIHMWNVGGKKLNKNHWKIKVKNQSPKMPEITILKNAFHKHFDVFRKSSSTWVNQN